MNNMKKKIIIILLILVTIISFAVIYQKQLISNLKIYEAQKALTYPKPEVETYGGDIGITLVENGKDVAYRNYSDGTWNEKTEGILFENLLQGGEEFKPGKQYTEDLKVLNSGDGPIYVRVTIYRYWIYDNGNQEIDEEQVKDKSKDPSLIQLNLINDNVWIEETRDSNPERTILYYKKPIEVGEKTESFCNAIQIKDENILAKEIEISNQDGHKVIEIQEEYEGCKAVVEVSVEAVQKHNAEDAIMSAWGVYVYIDENGNLNLL